ncbi:MAG: lyase family protein, partial [Candidatus Thorarchaeota archaeon]
MRKFRTETDSLGEVRVPADAYWGAVTQRAIENFRISGGGFPQQFIIALARVKKACALANMELGVLSEDIGRAIVQALDDVIVEKKLADQFPVDVYQSGSG